MHRWIVPIVGVVVVVAGVAAALLVAGEVSPTAVDDRSLDVVQVEAGVTRVLTDTVDGYGAQDVSNIRCNDGKNPDAKAGSSFTCTGTVEGKQRRVNAIVVDDAGTYEVDWPR